MSSRCVAVARHWCSAYARFGVLVVPSGAAHFDTRHGILRSSELSLDLVDLASEHQEGFTFGAWMVDALVIGLA